MTISVNNKQQELSDNTTVLKALEALGVSSFNGIAVAVNDTIIKKQDWDSFCLKPHDAMVLIRASQGG